MIRTGLAIVLAVLIGACEAASSPPPTIQAPASSETSQRLTTPLATTTTMAATTTTVEQRGWLVIHGTGDVNLDGDVIGALRSDGYDHAWSGLNGLFLDDDLSIINLECSPSPNGPPEPKQFVFGCDAEAYPAAIEAGVDVVNLGNNHSQDHGKAAMLEGRRHLEDLGLNPVGAGRNEAAAGKPAFFDIKGWRVAVVGFGGVFPHEGWFATPTRAGMRDGDTIDRMVAAVEVADRFADIVIVTIHWGVELDKEPRPEDRERAEAMIAAGADAIFGHHPHRLQPLEFIDDRPVAWSLGNFVWPNLSMAGSTTAVARVVISPQGVIDACLIPAFIESAGHPVLTGEPECGPGTEP